MRRQAAKPLRSSAGFWMCSQEFVHFLLRLFAFVAITLLQFTDHFLCVTFNLSHVVVGKFAPSRADLTSQLIPFALQNLRIHLNLLSCYSDTRHGRNSNTSM